METPTRARPVRRCSHDGCRNQVYARALCVRHGGKKQCRIEGCSTSARHGAFCLKHGGCITRRYCIEPGCTKQAHARQRCVRHGGRRTRKLDACKYLAKYSGCCRRHATVANEALSSTSAVEAMDIFEFDMLTLLAQPPSDAENSDDETARNGIDWVRTLNQSPLWTTIMKKCNQIQTTGRLEEALNTELVVPGSCRVCHRCGGRARAQENADEGACLVLSLPAG